MHNPSDAYFTNRPLTMSDAPVFVETIKAISANMGTNRVYQADYIQSQWQDPKFDITSSSHGIFTDDGLLAGYVVIWDTHHTPVHPWIEWGVHPDYIDHDLSSQLLQWADKTAQRVINRCPDDARISFHSQTVHGYQPDQLAFAQAGYMPIRYYSDMQIDMEHQPSPPQLADGLSFRSYQGEEDLPKLVDAFQDSFSDHFGYVQEPVDKEIEAFRYWFTSDKMIDPELIVFSIDDMTDEIVGYTVALKQSHGDPDIGYIDLVGVRRSYRRRGIAQALLLYTFNLYWNRGIKHVGLDVDADSLTNALKLYTRVGMYVKRQYAQYEKLVREGQEIATISVK